MSTRDQGKRTVEAADPQHDSGTDCAIALRFVHQLRFTRAVFDPDNPTFAEAIGSDAGRPGRLLAFVDSNLLAHQPTLGEQFERYVAAHADELCLAGPVSVVTGGERCKNDPADLQTVLQAINDAGLSRRSYIVAIGGGALLDVVGFGASIAHRGMRLVRLPTTTLGQCDSGVGVKNGVNMFGKKNYLGSFGVPWAVINDEGLLTTLSTRDWISGFSEAVKVALIKDRQLLDQIIASTAAIRDRNLARSTPILRRSAELHLAHIARGGDPFEVATTRPLDFGHWSAHKLEQITKFGLRHGEAVTIGLALDLVYGAMIGLTDWPTAAAVLRCLRGIGFQLFDEALRDTDVLLEGLEEFRQHLGGQLTLTMIRDAGQAVDVHEIDASRLRAAIDYLAERRDTDLWSAPGPV